MQKLLRWGALALVVIVLGIQLYRPEKNNPTTDPGRAMDARVAVPAPVRAILDRACADCHSHYVRWPWYSQVAPVSWLVADDVRAGRRHLNFSDWNQLDRKGRPRDTKKQLDKICEEVTEGGMPLRSYALVHRDARLSEADVKTVCDWARQGSGGRQ